MPCKSIQAVPLLQRGKVVQRTKGVNNAMLVANKKRFFLLFLILLLFLLLNLAGPVAGGGFTFNGKRTFTRESKSTHVLFFVTIPKYIKIKKQKFYEHNK